MLAIHVMHARGSGRIFVTADVPDEAFIGIAAAYIRPDNNAMLCEVVQEGRVVATFERNGIVTPTRRDA